MSSTDTTYDAATRIAFATLSWRKGPTGTDVYHPMPLLVLNSRMLLHLPSLVENNAKSNAISCSLRTVLYRISGISPLFAFDLAAHEQVIRKGVSALYLNPATAWFVLLPTRFPYPSQYREHAGGYVPRRIGIRLCSYASGRTCAMLVCDVAYASTEVFCMIVCRCQYWRVHMMCAVAVLTCADAVTRAPAFTLSGHGLSLTTAGVTSLFSITTPTRDVTTLTCDVINLIRGMTNVIRDVTSAGH
eukprot:743141-Rhodomonas_salina.7